MSYMALPFIYWSNKNIVSPQSRGGVWEGAST